MANITWTLLHSSPKGVEIFTNVINSLWFTLVCCLLLSFVCLILTIPFFTLYFLLSWVFGDGLGFCF